MARGTIHVPVAQGGNIHNKPIPLDHARVTVDGIQDAAFIGLPLPVPTDEQPNLGSVVGSFTVWSMPMILTDPVEVYCYYNFLS